METTVGDLFEAWQKAKRLKDMGLKKESPSKLNYGKLLTLCSQLDQTLCECELKVSVPEDVAKLFTELASA